MKNNANFQPEKQIEEKRRCLKQKSEHKQMRLITKELNKIASLLLKNCREILKSKESGDISSLKESIDAKNGLLRRLASSTALLRELNKKRGDEHAS